MGRVKTETAEPSKSAAPKLTKPAPLSHGHKLDAFRCGEEGLDRWLCKNAETAELTGTARTFVVCRGRRVVGYYSLATGSIAHGEVNAKLRKNAPDPIPVMILARLAVDTGEQGNGVGAALIRDAMMRVHKAAKLVGARTLIVHALNDRVAAMYRKLGFVDLPPKDQSKALHLPLDVIAKLSASSPPHRQRSGRMGSVQRSI